MDNMKHMVRDAEIFAVAAHGNQQYGFHPYYKHLKDVVDICEPYGAERQVLAWLHDVLEDTTCKQEQLIHVFDPLIARYCYLLSDPVAPSRTERKKLLNVVLSDAETPSSVLIVKAADRLANVRHSDLGNTIMIEKYRKEHFSFKTACYRDRLCDQIWNELDCRIAGIWK